MFNLLQQVLSGLRSDYLDVKKTLVEACSSCVIMMSWHLIWPNIQSEKNASVLILSSLPFQYGKHTTAWKRKILTKYSLFSEMILHYDCNSLLCI